LRAQSLLETYKSVIDMSDTNDFLINLSFSMHSGPGTFALLLGSGISQGAGIPTGWDIVLNLIRRLAAVEGEPSIDNPEQWFEGKYHEPPQYSFLIEKVASSPIARRNLLKHYIEPTDEQREQGLRIPSQSHKAIAQLVKNGTIRVILTTNIDQLLETALKEVGVTPVVIFNDDSLEGAMPYVHSPCTIIKLHGDYLDTRIKNTQDELALYSEKMNSCLDRIFEEFGLVICGWSANWDTALRDALYRRHNRRFSTYWAYRHDLSADALGLKNHLQAISLQIEDADKFFQKLSDNIGALQTFARPNPLSVPLAIAQVKKFIAEDKYRIQLHDLIQEIIEQSSRECNSEQFVTKGISLNTENFIDIFRSRMQTYEQIMQLPISALSTVVFFDNGKYSDEICKAVEKTIQVPYYEGFKSLIRLQYYPALLMSYTLGITALESKNYSALAATLLSPSVYDLNEKKPAIYYLNTWRTASDLMIKSLDFPDDSNLQFTPVSDALCKTISVTICPYFSNSRNYQEKFDIYEYLIGLVYLDRNFDDLTWKERNEAPVGRFRWRYRTILGIDDNICPIEHFFTNGLRQGENWELLKAGFFRGSPGRLTDCIKAFEDHLKERYHTNVMNFLGRN